MPTFRIILKPDAVQDLKPLTRYVETTILDRMERHLRFEPARVSRSRIKRLRGPQPADYRLRVGAYRIFYRIVGDEVHVLRVMHKEKIRPFYEEERP